MPTPEIYLHGFMAGPALWQPVHRHLTDLGRPGLRTALALPFHGTGPRPAPGTSFAQCSVGMWQAADAWAAQSPAAQGAQVNLVGYSLGARVALAMACQAPSRVASLTLIGVHPGLRSKADRATRRQHDAVWAARLRAEPLYRVLQAWDAQPLFAHRDSLQACAQEALENARQGLSGDGLASSLDMMGLSEMPDLRPALPSLTMPVHLVAGGLDLKFMGLAQMIAGGVPKGTLWPIEGGHHDVVLSHPQEVARVCLAAFGHGS